ncbi:hypothetical protein [Roseococcus sp.]|uniref:hypothetical protein n=1 Tax=Roseococcus sp. TaxID=2109646 RepID=UPI003BAC16E6
MPMVIADAGHEAGPRLIDYAAQRGARALLMEAGWHWEPETVTRMEQTARRLLMLTGVTPGVAPPVPAPRFAQVTHRVTARSVDFAFVQAWRGGAVIPKAGTLLAMDGEAQVRTPHADCLLVMPMLLSQPGQTAVRLARLDPV